MSHDDTIDGLIAELKSDDWHTRSDAARRLANLGPLATRAVPAMISRWNDSCWLVRYQVLRIIVNSRPYPEPYPEDTERVLRTMLEDDTEPVRVLARRVLQGFLRETERT
jgi:HEAT repeat protein